MTLRNQAVRDLDAKIKEWRNTKQGREKEGRYKLALSRHATAAEQVGGEVAEVTVVSFMKYITNFMDDNHGSTLSLKNVKSNLRCVFRRMEWKWLTENDQSLVAELENALKMADTTQQRRRDPLLRDILEQLIGLMDLSVSSELLDALMYMVCHDGLLRSGELLSGLRVRDFKWNAERTCVTIRLWRTKTHRAGDAVEVIIWESECPFSAVALLRDWMDLHDLWDCPDFQMFPAVRKGFFDFDGVHQKDPWIARLRARLDDLGFEGKHYGGHSFRSGGATDLFSCGIDLVLVMKFGRWTCPESALVYYKAASVVAALVAQAISGRQKVELQRRLPLMGAHWGLF